jgi:hypothetical protein
MKINLNLMWNTRVFFFKGVLDTTTVGGGWASVGEVGTPCIHPVDPTLGLLVVIFILFQVNGNTQNK